METVIEKTAINSNNRAIRWCIKLWTYIITIGITNELSNHDKKRTRLLNGICAMAVVVLIVLCIIYSDYKHRLTFWESMQGVVAYLVVLYLNYKKKYTAACHFFCIYNIISYSFQAVSHGAVDGVEYILVANSISSLLFFRKLSVIFIYFFLNAACFFLCKLSFSTIQPFLFMPDGENLYLSNHIILFLISFLIVYYFKVENDRQEKLLNVKNKNLADEKEKSDNLLLNILPYETAEELKATGTTKARNFNMVTVLFTDFKNFTSFSEKLSPEKLVAEINNCFCAFDKIISEHNVEKIKTIGDSYMCAGGLPHANVTNPVDVVMAALEIQDFMQTLKKEKELHNEPYFELRLGIHTGPVVAGIVGIKKFAYDIWGDTVNIASRMESSGEVNKVNISGATYELVKDHFKCITRGKIEAKNKGLIDMYFVEKV